MTGVTTQPTFARDPGTAAYYDRRADEYDDWYTGSGVFAHRDRPGWTEEVERLIGFVRSLPPARVLDVACGSGFLTRQLAGEVTAIDQSPAMVELTRTRVPHGTVIVGDALDLPFPDSAFDRVVSGHFYGHLGPDERAVFLAEARRVGRELVIIDSARRPAVEAEQWQERVLNDGSRHRIFKRYLTAAQLATEIRGEPTFSGDWFVAARSV